MGHFYDAKYDLWPSRRDVMVLIFGTQSVTFWYPTSFPQSRTLVRPPNPYLPLSLTLTGREGGKIAFHRPGAGAGAVARNALYGHRRALAPWRAAPSSIVFDDFIGFAFQRGIGTTRPDVRRSREVVAGETRWSRKGARSLPSILGLGIGVGKG